MSGFLAIRNWDRFQHYRDRRPPWIKFHVDWLEDYELARLPVASRLLASQLLLVAAKQDNRIPNDSLWIANRVTMTTQQVAKGITELRRIGFVEPIKRKRRASTVLPLARSQEVEVERQKTKGLNGSRPEGQGPGFQIPEEMLKDVS